MTRFRPCIDLHSGQVKQIVGSSLSDEADAAPVTNFVSTQPSSYFAELYKRDGLTGGHIIMLGKGNEHAAIAALIAYPGGLQIGGGIRPENASNFLEAGATHVIITSYIFDDAARFDEARLERIAGATGRERLVLDMSCRATPNGWSVAMNRWQTMTDLPVTEATIARLSPYCDELLIHAVDVEGKCNGMDEALLKKLAEWCHIPVTYAGGARSLEDLWRVQEITDGKVDVTIGSALDIFGGTGVRYADCVLFNNRGD